MLGRQDLLIDSPNEKDIDTIPIFFKELFQDHMATTRYRKSISHDGLSDDFVIDINVDCTDIDKIWNLDISGSLQSENTNLMDFELIKPKILSDCEEISFCDSLCINENELPKCKRKTKKSKRQSTRIENQTRKKIAEQIQRENVRLAMEAQLLTNSEFITVQDNNIFYINGKPASPATQKYLSLPTDLDAEEEAELEALHNSDSEPYPDEDVNKLCPSCQKPKGDSPMVCCDKCLRPYHEICIEASKSENFTCQSCSESYISPVATESPNDPVTVDNVKAPTTEDVCVIDDDDCLITMAEKPPKITSNIFQLIGTSEQQEPDVSHSDTPPVIDLPVMAPTECTFPCLSRGCGKLVDRNKSLYCSTNCIDAYSKMIIDNNQREKAKEYGLPKGPKLAKITRFVLAQPTTDTILDEYTAPSEDNLKEFLHKNPTFKVYQSTRPEKVKQTTEKVDKYPEVSNNDPTKHIKMVTHFATLFKKSMPLTKFNSEFNHIWSYCTKIEEEVSAICNHIIDDKYVAKIKELSDYLRDDDKQRLCSYILSHKMSVSELLSTNKQELEARSCDRVTLTKTDPPKSTELKTIVPGSGNEKPEIIDLADTSPSTKHDPQTVIIIPDDKISSSVDKKVVEKKNIITSKPVLSLFSDTTHLHGEHLYDMKCRVCNGALKSEAANKTKDKTPTSTLNHPDSLCTQDRENINPQTNKDDKILSNISKIPETIVELPDKCDAPSKSTNGFREIPLAYSKPYSSKLPCGQLVSVWEGKLSYEVVGTIKCQSFLVTRYLFDKHNDKDKPFLVYSDDEMRYRLDVDASIGHHLRISGRSKLSEVEDYLEKLRRRSDKEFLVLQLAQKSTNDDRCQYLALFDYLHCRTRCGRVNNGNVKDCFIYPLSADAIIPSIFMPFIGPGISLRRKNLLLLIVVRTAVAKLPFKPTSPKHDVEVINIDQSSHTLPTSTTPITSDILSWVINVRSDVSVERGNCEVDDTTSDKVTNNYEDSSISNTSESLKGNPTRSPPSETTVTNTAATVNNKQFSQKISDNVSNATSESQKIGTSLFLQRFADIVRNGPITNDRDCNTLSQSVADIISKNDTFDASIFQQMADIVIKVRANEAQESSETLCQPCNVIDNPTNQRLVNFSWHNIDQKVQNRFNTLWDEMDANTQYNLNSSRDRRDPDCEYKLANLESRFIPLSDKMDITTNGRYQFSSDRGSLAERYRFPSTVTKKDLHDSEKFDLEERYRLKSSVVNRTDPEVESRLNSSLDRMDLVPEQYRYSHIDEGKSTATSSDEQVSRGSTKSDSLEQMVMTESRNLYLKRKHSTRLYTYYDSFVNDDNSQEKRQKYFFSPHCEWASPEVVPLHCGHNHRRQLSSSSMMPPFRDCGIPESDRSKSLSVFALLRDTLK